MVKYVVGVDTGANIYRFKWVMVLFEISIACENVLDMIDLNVYGVNTSRVITVFIVSDNVLVDVNVVDPVDPDIDMIPGVVEFVAGVNVAV
jgi:hypothetical protein